jgi:hypothetical protein
MDLTLTVDEAALLKRVLTTYLGDLRFEIADTDKMDFRENLKLEEVFLKHVIDQLDEVAIR